MDLNTFINFFIYETYHLPEQWIQFQKFDLTPFPPKLGDFAENIRVKGTENQALSLHNGLEKQELNLRNGLEK